MTLGKGQVRAIIFEAPEKLFQRRMQNAMGWGAMGKILYQRVLSAPGRDMI